MSGFFPPWDTHRVLVEPYADLFHLYGWILLMGFLVTWTCGVVGQFLLLRRLSMLGDSISHSVLPGLALAFLLGGTLDSWTLFAGAAAAGLLSTWITESIHAGSRVRQDAAIGITFTTLFALGVVLITVFASKIHIDADCVLYGEIGFVPIQPFWEISGIRLAPWPVVRMAVLALVAAVLIRLFYKELLVSSFDPGLASTLGLRPRFIHYALMALVSVVIVGAFESVGAILAVSVLVLPGATARLLSDRLPPAFLWITLFAALSTLLGVHLSVWLDCSVAGAMGVASFGLFALVWIFHPANGLLRSLRRTQPGPGPSA